MRLDELIDRMVSVEELPEAQKSLPGEVFLRPIKKMVTLTAPQNVRTGESKQISFLVAEEKVDELRAWFRDLLVSVSDDISDRFHLKVHAPNGGVGGPVPLGPDEVLGNLVYAGRRDG